MSQVPPRNGGLRRVVAPGGAPLLALRDRGAVTGSHLETRGQKRRRGTTRSAELMTAIASLDTQPSPAAVAQMLDWIRQEYDARGGGALLGLFGRCYLGVPYVDHVMTTTGEVCEHYTRDDDVPPPYGAARGLVGSSAYLFVEVYSDGSVVPIRSDGSAVL